MRGSHDDAALACSGFCVHVTAPPPPDTHRLCRFTPLSQGDAPCSSHATASQGCRARGQVTASRRPALCVRHRPHKETTHWCQHGLQHPAMDDARGNAAVVCLGKQQPGVRRSRLDAHDLEKPSVAFQASRKSMSGTGLGESPEACAATEAAAVAVCRCACTAMRSSSCTPHPPH